MLAPQIPLNASQKMNLLGVHSLICDVRLSLRGLIAPLFSWLVKHTQTFLKS